MTTPTEKLNDPLWLQKDQISALPFNILTLIMNARREMDEGPLEYFTTQIDEGMWCLKSRPRAPRL